MNEGDYDDGKQSKSIKHQHQPNRHRRQPSESQSLPFTKKPNRSSCPVESGEALNQQQPPPTYFHQNAATADDDDDEEPDIGNIQQQVKVVVEVNNYNSALIEDSSQSQQGLDIVPSLAGKKTKIIAKVKPSRRNTSLSLLSSTTSSITVTPTIITTAADKQSPTKLSPSLSPGAVGQVCSRSLTNTPTSITPVVAITVPSSSSSVNLGATSPIFESGVNTECIALLRQLWNVHEELVDFHQQLLIVLTKCQQSVQFTLDLDCFDSSSGGSISSSKKFKSTAFVAAVTAAVSSGSRSPSPHQQPHSETTTTTTTTGRRDNNVNEAGSADHSLIREFIGCPAVDGFTQGLNAIAENVNEIEKQYNLISICQAQCKLVLYAKVRHAKKYVIHDRFSLLYTVHRLILTMIQLLASTTFWELHSIESIASHLLSILQLTEVYNSCLESTYESSINAFNLNSTAQQQLWIDKYQQNHGSHILIASDIKSSGGVTAAGSSCPTTTTTTTKTEPSPSPGVGTPTAEKCKISILAQILEAGKNDAPSARLSLKPLSATKLLQLFAQKRASFASYKFIHTIQTSFSLLSSGAHRTSLTKLFDEPPIILSGDKFETCFLDEDSKLSPFAKCFSKCPSLLGRAAVKKSENGQERLTASVRNKMYNYFRQVLWGLVGEIAEDLLLWDYSMGIPLVLYSLDVFALFKSSLVVGRRISENNPTPILPAIDSITNSLNSIVLLLSWDEKIRSGFETAASIKRPEQISLVRNPKEGEWATGIGSKFGDIITTCLELMEGDDGPLKNSQNKAGFSGSGLDSRKRNEHEEEPLCDEAQILFRLDATLEYYKAWVVKRCKSWLNSWAMPAFLACSQRDSSLLVQLIKSHQTMFITREILVTSPNVSIRLIAKHRRMCADDLQETLTKFQKMPEELLLSSGPICRMLSLATIQSYMPNPAHWRGIGPNSGLNPDKASPYVQTIISKVIEPVTIASVEFVSSAVQEAIGKQIIQATCEAWLQYILQKKIKFSEWGALQLLRDFMTLRDWIRNESLLEEEARKALLQLEILKRCEGVAFLLLRNPGDVLGVGKPSRRTRRVAPSGVGPESSQSSPSSLSNNSVTEDDIPPEMYVPNQQIWLELRLRRNLLSPCCE